MTEKERLELEVKFDKDTPKKHRFVGATEDKGVSVAVYVKKTRSIPEQITLKLTSK